MTFSLLTALFLVKSEIIWSLITGVIYDEIACIEWKVEANLIVSFVEKDFM
jgi:hypothetical protein